MDRFSEKSLLSLGDHYVYGLIDPRSKQIFYIGKGTKNRVFFVDERYEQGFPLDENETFYIGKISNRSDGELLELMRMKHSTLESR
mgnify:CR=1 FL=1|jgi:hypothetical protein